VPVRLNNQLPRRHPAHSPTTRSEAGYHAWLRRAVDEAETHGGPDAAAERFYRLVLGDETWGGLSDEFRRTFVGNGPAIDEKLTGLVPGPDTRSLAADIWSTLLILLSLRFLDEVLGFGG